MRDLIWHRGHAPDAATRQAKARLLAEVFETAVSLSDSGPDDWHSFALVAPDGHWVANVDAASLVVRAGPAIEPVMGLRSVAVAPDWRGQGLFRSTMSAALDWCDRQRTDCVLLYTGEPRLYSRFGFRDLVETAFEGPCPPPARAASARPLDLASHDDVAAITRIASARTPVSFLCTMDVEAARVLENLRDNDDLAVALTDETVIVYRMEAETLVVADVIGSSLPSLAELVGALGYAPSRVKTLFPPDRLGWMGAPVEEHTGLMIRGRTPAALTRPFMFPPTASF